MNTKMLSHILIHSYVDKMGFDNIKPFPYNSFRCKNLLLLRKFEAESRLCLCVKNPPSIMSTSFRGHLTTTSA